jgi:hypothetical protein
MGYFSDLDAHHQDWINTYLLDASDAEEFEFDVEWLIHCNTARIEGFTPLTREQFYAAARAALAKIDALFPTMRAAT